MTWTLDGDHLAADEVVARLRARIAGGHLETWLSAESGRRLAFVTNTERAMVMLLEEPGDAGEHATDPGADEWSDGFVLSNGQNDEYPGADTVPLDRALGIVEHLVAQGTWPENAHHVSDRG
ncbi:hypothetical protein [Lentzea sp. NPDC060358]|uniref:hypothetical protein n=1 Tax=Lentzea sp. NPDC060358 TaxID=3347103 RepID=UPI00365FB7C6